MAKSFRVMVRCPSSGKTVDTGVKTSGREALSNALFQDGRVNCPHCGQIHVYDGNAFLDVDNDRSGQDLWRPNA